MAIELRVVSDSECSNVNENSFGKQQLNNTSP